MPVLRAQRVQLRHARNSRDGARLRQPASRCRCAGFGCGGKLHATSYICDLFL